MALTKTWIWWGGRHGHGPPATHNTASTYPALVSFMGDTAVGKSCLIRAIVSMGHVKGGGRDMDDDFVSNDEYTRFLNQGPLTSISRLASRKDCEPQAFGDFC
jgi:hypothetical protein